MAVSLQEGGGVALTLEEDAAEEDDPGAGGTGVALPRDGDAATTLEDRASTAASRSPAEVSSALAAWPGSKPIS